jgi:hypothetical protein
MVFVNAMGKVRTAFLSPSALQLIAAPKDCLLMLIFQAYDYQFSPLLGLDLPDP